MRSIAIQGTALD